MISFIISNVNNSTLYLLLIKVVQIQRIVYLHTYTNI